MELWVYEQYCNIFKSQEEAEIYIAENEVYCGSGGLLSIYESGELYELYTFDELVEWCEANGYTIQEACEEFDISLKEWLCDC